VGLGGIVVNGVAGLEELDFVADLDFHFTFEHKNKFLAVMGGELLGIGGQQGYNEWLHHPVGGAVRPI
jgi:hypothetical protein